MAQLTALQSSCLASSSLLRGAELRLAPAFRTVRVAPTFSVQAIVGNKKSASAPATKPRVEDGIFGTSGTFGFTKQNELFVGRVAMLGFAASLLGEALTGQGILAQFNLETGIPISFVSQEIRAAEDPEFETFYTKIFF
jgi:hypothetical protein